MREDVFFSGSYGGDNNKIQDESKLECKICWYLYDPAQGDDFWQIPPGTPFSKLPDHWTCPECDGNKNDFLLVESS